MQDAVFNRDTHLPPQHGQPYFYRLMIPLCVIIVLLVSAFSIALLLANKQEMDRFSQHINTDALESFELALNKRATILNALEDILLENNNLYELLQNRDRAKLFRIYNPLFQKLFKKYSITHLYFHLPDRTNLLRMHKPNMHGDIINRFTMVNAQKSEKLSKGIELGPLGTLTLRVVQPIHYNEKLIGFLELGQEIEPILQYIEKRLHIDIALSINKNLLKKNQWESGMTMLGWEADWNRYPDKVLIYYSKPYLLAALEPTTLNTPNHSQQKVMNDPLLDNKTWKIFSHSLRDVSGKEIGNVHLFLDITAQKAAFSRLVIITATFALVLLTILFVFFYTMLRHIDANISSQQKQLIVSEKRQHSLLDAISESGIFLCVIDAKYHIRYMNKSMINIFGNKIGGVCYKDINGYDSPCTYCHMEQVISQGETICYHSVFANKQIYNTIAVPYVDMDGTPCKLGVMQDVTHQRRIEDEKAALEQKLHRAQKMEAIGLLAGGVAHDLNNILAGVVSYPEILLINLPHDHEMRGALLSIQEAGNRAANVVDDLLTAARGVARKKELHDLNQLIQEYHDSPECHKLFSVHPNNTIRLQLDASDGVISCSSVHIKKCLMNLVTNAAESTTGENTICISTHNQQVNEPEASSNKIETGTYVILSVFNSGPPISEEDLHHIFEPFYTKKVMGRSGTGLGLTVVWNTMLEHDGAVTVNSDSQRTYFRLFFPVDTKSKPTRSENEEEIPLKGNSEQILVVDDDPQLRKIAEKILEGLNYQVHTADCGASALHFVQDHPVDLLILDMLMEPGMNGRQTYEKILELYPGQRAIIISGFSESDEVKAALRLGANTFIKKPYSIPQISQAVQEALRA